MGVGESLFRSKWLMAQAEKWAAKDRVSLSELVGEAVGILIGIVILAFFAIHQTRPTGFFAEDFGDADAALLYLLIVMGMVSPVVRFIYRRRNIARPFDVFGMAVFFVAGLYFLIKWPFDFAYFADPLPRALEPLLDWVSGTLARWLLGIGVIVSVFVSIYTFLLYIGVKKRMSEGSSKGQQPSA